MRRFCGLALIFLAAVFPAISYAQLPIATGRSFTLSDPAWKLFIPSTYQQRGAVADVLVHFHGDPQTYWNNAKYANLNTIIVTVNYGAVSSAYQTPFTSSTTLFQNMMGEALTKVQQQSDFPDNLQWDKLGVSSFSAGYASVREILKQSALYNDIECMLLADTIYASYTSGTDLTPLDSQMVNFRSFAQASKNGSKSLFLTHSQVPTSGYCNTVATADDILSYLNVSTVATNTSGLGNIHFYRTAQAGNFKMYGATGTDGDSHLLHLQYSGQWLAQMPLAHVPEPGIIGLLALAPLVLGRKR